MFFLVSFFFQSYHVNKAFSLITSYASLNALAPSKENDSSK